MQLSGTGAALPVISGSQDRNPAVYNGQGNLPYTPYHLPIMDGWQWTASVQRRLPAKMVLEAQYVGSHWENEMFETDINSLSGSALGGSQANLPFPQYSNIGIGSGGARTGLYNGVSNYEAAMFMLHKPMGYGVSADISYAWSRLKDDMDSSGWGNQFGPVYILGPPSSIGQLRGLEFRSAQFVQRLDRILDTAGDRTSIRKLGTSGRGDRRLASVNFLHCRIGSSVHRGYVELRRGHAGERAGRCVLVS